MKTFLVRGFVLALAIAGFAASTQTAPSMTMRASVSSVSARPLVNVIPPPGCPGDDPTGCGID